MQRRSLLQLLSASLLLAGAPLASAAPDHPVIKRAVDLPPSADLSYGIKARQKGISLSGEATVNWRVGGGKYSVASETRAQILGKILENRSEGVVDSYGLAPLTWTEKRFRKDANTTTFDRESKQIQFSTGENSHPLLGGEQDRASAQWQLAAVARAAPDKMVAGSEWKFFVAGRKDAEQWTFKVIGHEKVQTALGQVDAVHFSKSPPADYPDQKLELWLAPSKEWYPVRLRFADDEGEFVDQTLTAIVRK